jgi:hypothetical protein
MSYISTLAILIHIFPPYTSTASWYCGFYGVPLGYYGYEGVGRMAVYIVSQCDFFVAKQITASPLSTFLAIQNGQPAVCNFIKSVLAKNFVLIDYIPWFGVLICYQFGVTNSDVANGKWKTLFIAFSVENFWCNECKIFSSGWNEMMILIIILIV